MTNPEPAYLLLGPEVGKKNDFIHTLREALTRKSNGNPEEYHFWPFESESSEIIALLKNGSLFGGHKLVRISQAEALSAADRKAFTDYLRQPSPDTVLVFSSEENKLNRSFMSFEAAFKKEQKKIFWELFENEKKGWITGYFRDAGRSIEPEAVDLILEMVENNTIAMRRECESLLLLTEGRSYVETDDIEEFLFHSREENVFSLFGKITEGRLTSALEALQKILDSGEGSSVQITGGLLWQFQKLLDLRVLTDSNYTFKDACDHLNIKGRRNQAGYQEGLSRYSAEELRNIIMTLADFDSALRQVRTDMEGTLLSMLVFTCVEKKGTFERIYSEAGGISNFT